VYVNARAIVPHAFWTARIEMLHLEAALKRFSRLARCVRTVFSLLAIALLKVPA